MKLSVIIPVYNEEDNIVILYNQLIKVINNYDYEIIFIDDGSKDNTFKNLESLNKKNSKVRVIRFRKNFGQTAALSAGFDNTKGDVIITMDGDLQNDPSDIPLLINNLKYYDVVSGWRYNRKDPLFTKKIPSKFSNWIFRKLIGLNIHDSGCSLKAYKKETLDGIKLYGEMHRFIPALIALNGYKIGEVKVKHYERKYGKTKYNFKRLLKGFLDLLYIKFWATYSTRPLHFFGLLGFLQYFLAVLIFIEQIIKAFYVGDLNLGPLLMLGVLFIVTGTLFIIFGFLGEILIRDYYKDKKSYSIEKIL